MLTRVFKLNRCVHFRNMLNKILLKALPKNEQGQDHMTYQLTLKKTLQSPLT